MTHTFDMFPPPVSTTMDASLTSTLVHSDPVCTVMRVERARISKRSANKFCSFYLFYICYKCVRSWLQLFEEVTRENSQLQSQLQDTQRIVSQTRLDLEKATQVPKQETHPHTRGGSNTSCLSNQ